MLNLAFPYLMLFFILIGLFGLVVPIFPGNTVIWAAALVYGLVNGWDGRAWLFFVPITLLTLAAWAADNLLVGAKALKAGAAWWSILIALLSGFIVSLFFTPIAGLIAAPTALYISEYFRNKHDGQLAWKITASLLIGWGWAFVVRFGLGVLVVGLYLWWVFGVSTG